MKRILTNASTYYFFDQKGKLNLEYFLWLEGLLAFYVSSGTYACGGRGGGLRISRITQVFTSLPSSMRSTSIHSENVRVFFLSYEQRLEFATPYDMSGSDRID